ncbi:nose resistant to fluoxetine protein 6-like [Antedon mediterranea]|uniref:nose resistant to fluoxetine protein 6-like n=1 Tax=Antedon mediterranea TaxID=105859 RepID=UPI003AF4A074
MMKTHDIVIFLIVASFCCDAQFHAVNNEQRIGELKTPDKYMPNLKRAQDIMSPLVYDNLLKPMLKSADQQRGYELDIQQEEEFAIKEIVFVGDIQDNATSVMNTVFTTERSTTSASPSQCVVDFGHFQTDLQTGKLYALKMVDSYGKLPPGLFQGAVTWPGLYDECQAQSRSWDVNGSGFNGRHCIATLTNSTPNVIFQTLNVGICVPDSCNKNQVTNLLSGLPRHNVANMVCSKDYDYSASAIACLTLLSTICIIVICATLYDIVLEQKKKQVAAKDNEDGKKEPENNSFFSQLLLCFSLLVNGRHILKTKQGEQSLGALNGIRVISLWWVILGHSYANPIYVVTNILTPFDAITRFTFQAIVNATFSVDSFFFLSGLLVTYLTLKYLQKNDGKLNWLMFYVHRYLRLTPIYMLVIFMFTTLTPYFGTGAFYTFAFDPEPVGVESQVSLCQKYWWTNLLYINNLYPTSLQTNCLGWGWYLANDMQFYIISPFVVYLLYHYFYAGVVMWMSLLIACFGSLIGVSIKYNVTTKFIPDDLQQKNFTADELYARPWARISPFLVGMAIGYILYKYKDRVRMNLFSVIMGWILASAIGVSVVYGLYGNYHDKPLGEAESVLYITLSRFAWAVALGWVAFACVTGYGGPVNSLLSWSFWIPLSRMNYGAYLLHPIIMMVFYYTQPDFIYYTGSLMVYFYVANVVLAYAAAFVLSITVEAPFMGLEKLLLKREKSV